MNEQNKKVPDLRFKGFTDDWEQHKLGEIAKIIGGGTPSTQISRYWNGNINWYTPAELGSSIYVNKSERQITQEGFNNSSTKLLPKGTVLFTSRAGIGKTAILCRPATTNQGFQSIVPKVNMLDSYFLFSLTNQLKHYGETHGAGSTFVEISGKELAKVKLKIPTLKEQKTIAILLKTLDSIITLHQRKLDLLKQLKKGLLQKMFADKGSKRPILRFEGFNDDWERRKLGEYFPNILSGNRLPKTMIVKGDVPYVIATTENNGVGAYLSENQKDYSNNNMKKFDRNSITVSIDNPEAIFIQTKTFVASNVMRVLHNSKLDFDELNFFKQILKIKAKGFDWSSKFSGPVIKNISFFAPSDNKEMQKIGKVITNLDSLIALHQRKQNHLKLLKKSLLQQMFM